jgi:hypothetical protein
MQTNIVSFSVDVGAFASMTVRYRVPLVQTVSVSNILPNNGNSGASSCVRIDIQVPKEKSVKVTIRCS